MTEKINETTMLDPPLPSYMTAHQAAVQRSQPPPPAKVPNVDIHAETLRHAIETAYGPGWTPSRDWTEAISRAAAKPYQGAVEAPSAGGSEGG